MKIIKVKFQILHLSINKDVTLKAYYFLHALLNVLIDFSIIEKESFNTIDKAIAYIQERFGVPDLSEMPEY